MGRTRRWKSGRARDDKREEGCSASMEKTGGGGVDKQATSHMFSRLWRAGLSLTPELLWKTYSIYRELVHRKSSASPKMRDLPVVRMAPFQQRLIADSSCGWGVEPLTSLNPELRWPQNPPCHSLFSLPMKSWGAPCAAVGCPGKPRPLTGSSARLGCRRYEEQQVGVASIMPAASRGEEPLTTGQGRALMSGVKAPRSLHLGAGKRWFRCSNKTADNMFKTKLTLSKFLKFTWSWKFSWQTEIIISKVMVTVNGTWLAW